MDLTHLSVQSPHTYQNIKEITSHKKIKTPLTQVDIDDPHNNTKITLTTKAEMEDAITKRNQKHARQSLQTPFANIPELKADIDPHNCTNNKIDDIL